MRSCHRDASLFTQGACRRNFSARGDTDQSDVVTATLCERLNNRGRAPLAKNTHVGARTATSCTSSRTRFVTIPSQPAPVLTALPSTIATRGPCGRDRDVSSSRPAPGRSRLRSATKWDGLAWVIVRCTLLEDHAALRAMMRMDDAASHARFLSWSRCLPHSKRKLCTAALIPPHAVSERTV